MNEDMKLLPEKKVITLQGYFENLCILNKFKEDDNEGVDRNSPILKVFNGKRNCRSTISLCNLGIQKLPNGICNLKYLTMLDLSNNLLETLPEEIGGLFNLIVLKLNNNHLNSLPKNLKKITSLNHLDISCNKFTEVPEIIYYSLRGLRLLDLSVNKIKNFNDPPGCFNKLTVLNLSSNILDKFPEWIFDNLCRLKFLDCSKNPLCFNTKSINYYNTGIFDSLKTLKMENCNLNLGNVDIFFYLKNIKILQVGNNEKNIFEKKNYFGDLFTNNHKILESVKCFYVQNTKIGSLPSNIDCLKNIETLDLSQNLLSWLPDSFCNLTNLKILNLNSNQLLFLPKNIGNLKNLKQILLGDNKLTNIPESFYNLINLEFVDFYNNQIDFVNFNFFAQKNLKGLDLGMNCMQFDAGVVVLYNNLRDSFRECFCVESRCDLQMSAPEKSTDVIESHKSDCSFSSDNEVLSDLECLNEATEFVVEDWENVCLEEKDESFNPNRYYTPDNLQISHNVEFKDNYCPANYHVPSVMKQFVRNFKCACKNEVVEGQFDSD